MALGYILAFAAGYYLVTTGDATLGTAYLLVYYTDTLFDPLRHLTMELEHFQKSAASIARLRELLGRKSTCSARQRHLAVRASAALDL